MTENISFTSKFIVTLMGRYRSLKNVNPGLPPDLIRTQVLKLLL
jgi:hypothetical protein